MIMIWMSNKTYMFEASVFESSLAISFPQHYGTREKSNRHSKVYARFEVRLLTQSVGFIRLNLGACFDFYLYNFAFRATCLSCSRIDVVIGENARLFCVLPRSQTRHTNAASANEDFSF